MLSTLQDHNWFVDHKFKSHVFLNAQLKVCRDKTSQTTRHEIVSVEHLQRSADRQQSSLWPTAQAVVCYSLSNAVTLMISAFSVIQLWLWSDTQLSNDAWIVFVFVFWPNRKRWMQDYHNITFTFGWRSDGIGRFILRVCSFRGGGSRHRTASQGDGADSVVSSLGIIWSLAISWRTHIS